MTAERQADIERLVSGKALLLVSVSGGGYSGHSHSLSFSPRDAQQQEGEGGDTPRRSSLTSSDGAGTAGAGGREEDGDAAVASGGGRRKSSSNKAEPAEAVVGDGRYKMVWSALLLVDMLVGCLNVAANFPNLSLDVMQRVVDLLRVRARHA